MAQLTLYHLVLEGESDLAREEVRRRIDEWDTARDVFMVEGIRLLECALQLRDNPAVGACRQKLSR